MKQYLIELDLLLKTKENVTTYEGMISEITMNNPASLSEIRECEKSLSQKFPEDYIFFLKQYNGGIIFKFEDIAGYDMLGTKDVCKENAFQKKNFGEDWSDDILLFCRIVGVDEYLGFKKNGCSYKILHCIMDSLPNEWTVIANSFDDFMLRLIKERGKEYWLFSEGI